MSGSRLGTPNFGVHMSMIEYGYDDMSMNGCRYLNGGQLISRNGG
jgi:hypothetical protein